jgi:hypothetical protein
MFPIAGKVYREIKKSPPGKMNSTPVGMPRPENEKNITIQSVSEGKEEKCGHSIKDFENSTN